MRLFLCSIALSLVPAVLAAAGPESGEAVFEQRCAACHDQNNPRIPPRESLQKLPAARILRALNYGAMITIGYTMNMGQREAVANWLGTPGGSEPGPPPTAFCADRRVRIAPSPKLVWNGWSPTAENTRFQTASEAGLSLDGVRNLKLKWAFAFQGDITAFSQPAILDGNLFVGSAGGAIHDLDAQTGCIRWMYQASGPVRTAILAVRDGRRYVLLFGDQSGWFYALDAQAGKLLWKKKMDPHDAARLTGAAVAHDGIVYVPVASWEENRASELTYECCTMRGSVVALRVHDGSQIWKTYMTEPPKLLGKNPAGRAQYGPSGAGVWSAPTLDIKRGVMYVTTGDNYSQPATKMSDAVVALAIKTGKVIWSQRFGDDDIFSGECLATSSCGPDYDFGSSAMLVNAGGRSLLVAGQKSGVVYALDPDKKGELVWQLRVGKGSTNGGVLWGMASDGQNAYAAVSDIARKRRSPADAADLRTNDVDPNVGGGLTAIRLTDGAKVWYSPGQPCGTPKAGCSPAQPAAVTAIPGVVFSGSVDGHMRAYAAEDGRVLWDFDTARDFETVNGVAGHGGSIDGPGAVVVGGMVYVNSGYSRQSGMPGNVLLAFEAGK
ncbi:MAG TPA: PQQ-binding-like beta-propeller repeat protein [Bryobacteraceae bacterium]|jgi:polyvinyl alcohol dehydrogenase (cytochrome)|nr:PQQ-binding-like beta-propeller repeat protein [Bryobacteraceae bacterium]